MQRLYAVVLAVACVTRMIPLLVLRAEPVLVVLYGGSWSLDEGR